MFLWLERDAADSVQAAEKKVTRHFSDQLPYEDRINREEDLSVTSQLRSFACIAALALISTQSFPQSKNALTPSKLSINGTGDTQWEYLVVSYGKTVFGSPEKTLAYRAIGLGVSAQEANDIQRNLDILGRFGWELISIVGAIGGDQQLVFKRQFDRSRSSSEASAILKGKDLYLKDLIDVWERARRVREEAAAIAEAEKSKPRLIELDALDEENRREKMTADRRAEYEAAIATTTWGDKAKLSVSADPGSVFVDVKIDVTGQALRDGGTYRKSEISSWLKQTALSKLQSASQNWSFVMLNVEATLEFQGKTITVAKESSTYSSLSGRWN